jgi:hypothetical protein
MSAIQGYFCLIQYCPDLARQEAVNVGVLVFCPQSGFLEIKLTEDNDRVARLFGKHSFHPASLDAAKRGLVYRLTAHRGPAEDAGGFGTLHRRARRRRAAQRPPFLRDRRPCSPTRRAVPPTRS